MLLPDLARVAAQVPLERLHWQPMAEQGLECWIRRDDLLPAWCQGNKFYKLYYNLLQAPEGVPLVSFGGAFSNHLYALAMACQALERQAIGIVRGERQARLSPTLEDAEAAGMQLVFVSRQAYRTLCALEGRALMQAVAEQLGAGEYCVIPEGGANALGMRGCEVLGQDIARRGEFTEVCLAAGTATTLAGVAKGLGQAGRVAGVSVLGPLKAGSLPLAARVCGLLGEPQLQNWQLLEGMAPGRYGQCTEALAAFMADFFEDTGVQLDHVYTAKLFWVLQHLAEAGRWPRGSRVLAIHTGGLQGLRGLEL
ncbi:pyridoxal-phosphate dependent enzyme [Simiduia sp. 21SJ11W-1]|uniref:1-aminocyclopropane-1-carboxylate deaminase/D-cysteine desulfhydrase n=1 Tax=Simiduia sp. 21SJ11W-1 TaxID=2909669 RepID=UPI0020A1F21E|nr:pyridoxal-phosphate dependent enzyme [Simiduia sp. 21SJ11W-1]UTA49342.1 pyridoxal-phosphate dependent enzyme [Simiduia sp. 21SJ11W-1]